MIRDADLRALVSYDIKRANAAIMGDVERILGRFGLRRTTFSALSVIAGNEGIRQSDVADVLAIERPNLVQILDDLQRSSLIKRARDTRDRRAYLLSATATGAELLAQADTALRTYDGRLTDGMSAAERAALTRALALVEANGALAGEGLGIGEVSTT
jgi:DNA-binding MarR family transcriptional regulator